MHAGTQARFEEGYQRIAEAADIDDRHDPKANILRLVRNWLCDESKGRWLIIVDNADDSELFFPSRERTEALPADRPDRSAPPLSDFLPQSPNGSILFTSRSRDAAFRLTGSHMDIVTVDPMNQEHAMALVRKKLQSSFEEDDAIALIGALDYMPLAIAQAAAYINQRAPRATLSKFVQDLRRGHRDQAKLLDTDIGDFRRDSTASNSIIATWQISFEHIRRTTPSATQLLSLMSLFDRQGIPESLLRGRYRETDNACEDFEDDLNVLLSFSLISMSFSENQLEMHRLVQLSTKSWLELNEELENWKEKYIMLMEESYPTGKFENWPVCQALFPHAQAVVEYRPTDPSFLELWASILYKAAWYARGTGRLQKAYQMDSAALETRTTILGAEHPDTLNSINNLGVLLERQGKYNEAEALHRRALEATETILGAKHQDTLISVNNLGSVLERQGKYNEAEALHRRALEARETILGAKHQDTLKGVNSLATVLEQRGKYNEAEALYQRSLEEQKRVFGSDHVETIITMGNLAKIYGYQMRLKQAEELWLQTVETSKRVLGRDHPCTLANMNGLVVIFQHQRRLDEAEKLGAQAMKTSKKVLGQDHPDTLASIGNLASMFADQRRWKEAEELQVQLVEARERVMGQDHSATLIAMHNLAFTLNGKGEKDMAMKLMEECIERRKKALGCDHPNTKSSERMLNNWRAGR